MNNYPWYETIDSADRLQQGDMIKDCSVLVPREDKGTGDIIADGTEYDVIVMSQSCDLDHRKIELVLVCPYMPFTAVQRDNQHIRSSIGKKQLKNGHLPGYHLIESSSIPDLEHGHLIVDFHNVYGVPLEYLEKRAAVDEKRLRLLPPYREHLSQAFARFFMRVGLPTEISALPN